MADETTGVNYGLLGPHSGTQFKPTSLKDVEQYMRDVRELKRKKAEERGLQALQTGGIDAMRKSLVSDGFGELAEPMERQVAQARQQEILSTLDNARKLKQYENANIAPRGTADKMFNSQQVEVPSQTMGIPVDSRTQRANPLSPKVGQDEAIINAPATLPAPEPTQYRKQGAPAATQFSQDLVNVPYVDPNAPPETKPARAYNWAYSDPKNPNYAYEGQIAAKRYNLSGTPDAKTITENIYREAEAIIPQVPEFGDMDELDKLTKARKSKVDEKAFEIGQALDKQANELRTQGEQSRSAEQNLAFQKESEKRAREAEARAQESATREREAAKRFEELRNSPEISPAKRTSITTPEQALDIKRKAADINDAYTDLDAWKKSGYKDYTAGLSFAERLLRAQSSDNYKPTFVEKINKLYELGWSPSAKDALTIRKMLANESTNQLELISSKVKSGFSKYSPGNQEKIDAEIGQMRTKGQSVGVEETWLEQKKEERNNKDKQDKPSVQDALKAKGRGGLIKEDTPKAKKEDKPAAPKSDNKKKDSARRQATIEDF